ncbi:MAG: MATE family efflux transporter [Lachnospiraceae bacterium]|uniref:MATE family efflux transporter n=1 Tax=Anaerostipes sp. TaxID=1872530 RepID=UPI00258B4948|nr:MATE family efflux transporter [Anaerostipes sp.]MCI5622130.1 MATE family efflux transporter [Anaerostipes sp.]MDD7112939.1 MATE family efflux transporter [Lachnospiraceae bacterium]
MNQKFMKEKPILPLVLSMALPMVISMAVNSLYNIVDSFFIAKISENAMTSLSLVYPLQNLMTAIAVGFGIGINARIAYCLGAGDQKRANQAATTGMLLSLIHGAIVMVICLVYVPHFLSLYTQDKEIIDLGLIYAHRVFIFSIINMLGISLEKIFQSVGRMKVSMCSMMSGFITNIILDQLMIFGIGVFPEMGMAGAAYATGIGQTVTLLVYLLFCKFRPLPLSFTKENISFQWDLLRKLYAVGIPASLNMALPSLMISVLNRILTSFSEMYVLVLGVYYKLQTFIYLSANGIIQGIRPLMSYNYGAKENKRVQKIFLTTLCLTASVMIVGVFLSMLIPRQMIALFTENTQTIQIGVNALTIICKGFIISALSITCCGALEALGKGIASLIISLLRYVIVMIPAAFILSSVLGADGVFWAFPLTETVAAIAAIILYRMNVNSI